MCISVDEHSSFVTYLLLVDSFGLGYLLAWGPICKWSYDNIVTYLKVKSYDIFMTNLQNLTVLTHILRQNVMITF